MSRIGRGFGRLGRALRGERGFGIASELANLHDEMSNDTMMEGFVAIVNGMRESTAESIQRMEAELGQLNAQVKALGSMPSGDTFNVCFTPATGTMSITASGQRVIGPAGMRCGPVSRQQAINARAALNTRATSLAKDLAKAKQSVSSSRSASEPSAPSRSGGVRSEGKGGRGLSDGRGGDGGRGDFYGAGREAHGGNNAGGKDSNPGKGNDGPKGPSGGDKQPGPKEPSDRPSGSLPGKELA